jgi:Tol biopolymer transport system component
MSTVFVRGLQAALVGVAAVATANAQLTTFRVSVDSAGQQSNNYSSGQFISDDGRFVVFGSRATNLVVGDTNNYADVFIRDLQNGTTERVSVSSSGVQGNKDSGWGSASHDGRLVVFDTLATSLVPTVSGQQFGQQVLLRDRQTGLTTCLSVDLAGLPGNGSSGLPSISADGRYVVFESYAALVPQDTNGVSDVYLRDVQQGATQRVSVSSIGTQGNADSLRGKISGDGSAIVFYSYASNLVPGDTNGVGDVFVRDRLTGVTNCVSVTSAGVQGNQQNFYATWLPSISYDGRYVAFDSFANNLVANDNNAKLDVFVHDRQTGVLTRASVDSLGAEGNGVSGWSSISSVGPVVMFLSYSTNLVPGDTNLANDVFAHDLATGVTSLVSTRAAGMFGDGGSGMPSMTRDGRWVAYFSEATNLVASDTNGVTDVFVREIVGEPPSSYCTAGTTTNGCVSAISSTGTPSATAGSGFTIAVTAMEGQKQALLFYGTDNSGFAALPWGPGPSWLCVKPPVQRTGVYSSGGSFNACDGALALDWNSYVATTPSALGSPFAPGQLVFAQAWFRDPPSAKTTALSDALAFLVGP